MNFRDSALVAFTLLMQASVGILLVVAALPLVTNREVPPSASRMVLPVAIAGFAAVVGLIASLLHLGHPMQAWLAVANVRHSWLSREIVLAVVFVVAGILFARTHHHPAAPVLRALATAVMVVAGVGLVFAMARLYMIAGQPGWNRITTPLAFFATTALLGLVVTVTVAAPPLEPRTARLFHVAAVTLLALQLLLVPAWLAAVAGEPSAAISPASAGHVATWLALARVVFALAAVALILVLLRSGPTVQAASPARLAVLVLVVLSEVLGRILFYATAVRL